MIAQRAVDIAASPYNQSCFDSEDYEGWLSKSPQQENKITAQQVYEIWLKCGNAGASSGNQGTLNWMVRRTLGLAKTASNFLLPSPCMLTHASHAGGASSLITVTKYSVLRTLFESQMFMAWL